MSWLFGMNKKQDPPTFPQPPSDGAPGGGGGGGGQPAEQTGRPTAAASSTMEAYRFDSSALERAAQAAKDLEKSGEYAAVSVGPCEHVHRLDVETFTRVGTLCTNSCAWLGTAAVFYLLKKHRL